MSLLRWTYQERHSGTDSMTTTAAISSAQQFVQLRPAQDQPELVQVRPETPARPCQNTNEGDLDNSISCEFAAPRTY